MIEILTFLEGVAYPILGILAAIGSTLSRVSNADTTHNDDYVISLDKASVVAARDARSF